jgi:hypothetical protein
VTGLAGHAGKRGYHNVRDKGMGTPSPPYLHGCAHYRWPLESGPRHPGVLARPPVGIAAGSRIGAGLVCRIHPGPTEGRIRTSARLWSNLRRFAEMAHSGQITGNFDAGRGVLETSDIFWRVWGAGQSGRGFRQCRSSFRRYRPRRAHADRDEARRLGSSWLGYHGCGPQGGPP